MRTTRGWIPLVNHQPRGICQPLGNFPRSDAVVNQTGFFFGISFPRANIIAGAGRMSSEKAGRNPHGERWVSCAPDCYLLRIARVIKDGRCGFFFGDGRFVVFLWEMFDVYVDLMCFKSIEKVAIVFFSLLIKYK